MTETTETDPLKSYLDYYKELENPGYAVLVTGEWGSGKTFQVKAALQPNEYLYVSLFGLTSDEDVYGSVLAKMHPGEASLKKISKNLANKTFTFAGFGGSIGGLGSAYLNAYIRDEVDNSKIIIFDDFERSGIETQALLGIVNFYVEHHGCKVVVIAFEEKVIDKIRTEKEKLFGQTIKIVPKLFEAFDKFVLQVVPARRELINPHLDLLKEIFIVSQCQSLRILKQVILDSGHLLQNLETRQLCNRAGIESLLKLFVALNIEIRLGNLDRTDLIGRANKYWGWEYSDAKKATNGGSKTPSFVICHKKFKATADLNGEILTDELLVQMLVDGNYNKQNLQSHLQTVVDFQEAESKPTWWTFWQYPSIPALEVRKAIAELDRLFEERSFPELGDFLHAVSIRFWRIHLKFDKEDADGITLETKKYLDDVVASGRFPTKLDRVFWSSHLAHGGYGISPPPEFQKNFAEIRSYLRDCERRARKVTAPEYKRELLDWIANAPARLYTALNSVGQIDGKYSTIPVLTSLTPYEFVDAFFKSPIANWKETSLALAVRKSNLRPGEEIYEELEWLNAVDKLFVERRDASTDPIVAAQIQLSRPITDAQYEAEQQATEPTAK